LKEAFLISLKYHMKY